MPDKVAPSFPTDDTDFFVETYHSGSLKEVLEDKRVYLALVAFPSINVVQLVPSCDMSKVKL